ncbi:MAG TPA: hypothetical protein PKW95_10845 [bacterium]|nr:hypothetical protein [bacterium]
MSGRIGLSIAFVCLIVLAIGCSSTRVPTVIPGEHDDAGVEPVDMAQSGARFTTGALPGGWNRLRGGGATVAFTRADNRQSIFINVIYAPNRKADVQSLRNHLLFDITSREISEQKTIEVDNREALWTVVEGRLDGARVKMAVVVLRMDAWIYDFCYVSVPEYFDEALADFKRFVHNFHHHRTYPPGE